MKSNERTEIRTYIKTRPHLNISVTNNFNELCAVYGRSAVSLSTVCRWMKKFKNGIGSAKDAARSGRPETAITDQTIAAVKKLVDEDATYTLQYIARSVGKPSGKVHEFFTKHLQYRKI